MLVAWLHAAIAVAPVSGLVHAGSQLVADRYSYLPGIGFAMVAGGAITAALDAWRRGRLATGMMATIAGVTVAALVTLGRAELAALVVLAQLREPLALGGGRR